MTVDFNTFFNKQAADMRPSPTFAVMNKARERKAKGLPVFDFSVGQPAEPTPDYVFDELKRLMEDPATRLVMSQYSPVNGLPKLKDAIVHKFKDENGLEYAPDEILVSNGGKQAIFNVFAVTLEKGDKVLLPEPSWVSYADMVKWQGAEPVGIRTREDFKFTAETLAAHLIGDTGEKIKWIVLNSPSNPTGATYSAKELKEIAGVVLTANSNRIRPVMVMSDDIYEHMVYDDKLMNDKGVSHNVAMVEPRMKPYTLIINGVAKAFAMTGWRVGYAAGPKDLIDKMGEFQGLTTSGVSAVSQLAAAAALSPERKTEREAFFAAQREKYRERRAAVEEALAGDENLRAILTPGAFYAMIDASKLGIDSKTLATRLIDEKGVAMVPGDDFYVNPPEDKSLLRMSYATSVDTIKAGLAALREFAQEIAPGRDRSEPPAAARG